MVADAVLLKIKKQDDPSDLPYWERFEIPYKRGMTVASALDSISMNPVTVEGRPTSPPVHEAECRQGACGACTMVINGRVRLACKTLIDDLNWPVTIEPMSKFPIIRDLMVDRKKMFDSLNSFECWVELDCIDEIGCGISKISDKEIEKINAYSSCIMCGACVEACPQVNERMEFSGSFVFARLMAMDIHPSCKNGRNSRFDRCLQKGGISDCVGTGNCAIVCPVGVPLSSCAGALGLRTGLYSMMSFFVD